MPMTIAMPRKARVGVAELPERERKTSLTDRTGILVPPLFAAMRERGIKAGSNSLGLATPTPPGAGAGAGGATARDVSPSRPTRESREPPPPGRRGSRSAPVRRSATRSWASVSRTAA